jgi:hypothetical protein
VDVRRSLTRGGGALVVQLRKRMNRHTTDSGDKVLHSCDDVRTYESRIIVHDESDQR